MKMTIDEYCKYFKMSKEVVHSKIRAKTLKHTVQNKTIYIMVEENGQNMQTQNPKKRTTVATVLALYQKENAILKEKILQLETKIDKLIDDKEQMLRDERDRIENLYITKDEQLKNILELINTKLMLEKKQPIIHEAEPLSSQEIEKKPKEQNQIVELREYLKTLGLKPHQRKVIKKRFLAVYDRDVRVIKQNGKLYLDFSKYDYSDLLEY